MDLTFPFVTSKMYGKQIYKGTLDRTVLGDQEASLARMYNKHELAELFRLDDDGVCESYAWSQSRSVDNSWKKKCSLRERHQLLVGISRRSDIYKNTFKEGTMTNTPQEKDTEEALSDVAQENACVSDPKLNVMGTDAESVAYSLATPSCRTG